MQKGFAQLILIAIFAVAILSIAGVYLLNIKNQPSESVQYKPVPPVSSPNPPLHDNVFKDQSGLQFTIPAGFEVTKETEQEYFKRVYGDTRKNFTYYVQYPPPEFVDSIYILENTEKNLDKARLSITIFENPNSWDATRFYKEYWYYPFVWGDFTAGKNNVAPENIELIGGKEAKSGIVDYREGKPKFIYLPWGDKGLMLQIQMPSQDNETGKKILESLRFE